MKHLRLYEDFDKKPYYEFDAIKFYNNFKEIFNSEKEIHPDFSGDFFNNLNSLFYNWERIPLDTTIEQIVKEILQDKEIEFYEKDDYYKYGRINIGRVKSTKFYYSAFFNKHTYIIDLYDEYTSSNVDYSRGPVKIYGKPTEIENVVDLYLDRNKFNI